ncbi:MAG: cysteine synthase family protein [Nitrososphaeraceae archaeon]|jgi:cysteine synthase B|nr:cysteine synthase family protein [Nitrososphaeraceae archaeon]MDW0136896.1 cysteine synthase family protein [Nitrososphaeraceae archaeon]MDW0138862.1 cysteine synthase family protein [Nitrososphaeraceae archaeon]MDW0142509.1 cysteine synthase family protein [Nitrososphaeraceae archaeon]MDW0143920.1 cysteine synthase family protein [Nitrososphaeraceae archaeon]
MTSIIGPEILQRIGNTPLYELSSYSNENIKFYAKLEWYNPFGSVKDRAAYWMVKDAEKKGLLVKNKSIIIEPTSGNTGIALTGIASSMGYKVEIVIPEKVSEETKKILRNLGASLHETSDDLCPRVGAGTDQSIALATAIAKPRSDIYYMPNQYENESNFLAHYESTGPEIWEQTNGKVTHFFTGCGTGGTITGTGTFLKEKNKNMKVIAIQAQQNHLLQGLRNFEESSMPNLFKRRETIVDQWMTATNQESFDAVKDLLKKEGLFVGPSSGSVMSSMLKFSKEIDKGVIVGIFADDGRKFKSLYKEQNVLAESDYVSALEKLPELYIKS